MTEISKEKSSISPFVKFWMSLSSRRTLQEYIQEWVKFRPSPIFEEITKKRKEIVPPKAS
jgi:hypothetical protein